MGKRVAWVEFHLDLVFVLAVAAYVWLLTAWVVVWAALTNRTSDRDEEALLQRFLRHRRG